MPQRGSERAAGCWPRALVQRRLGARRGSSEYRFDSLTPDNPIDPATTDRHRSFRAQSNLERDRELWTRISEPRPIPPTELDRTPSRRDSEAAARSRSSFQSKDEHPCWKRRVISMISRASPNPDAQDVAPPRAASRPEYSCFSNAIRAPAFKDVSDVEEASCALECRFSPLRSSSIRTSFTFAGTRTSPRFCNGGGVSGHTCNSQK